MAEFNIAIIGAGGISTAHINAAKASNGRIGIAAIVDPSEPVCDAAAQAAGCLSFPSIDPLFTNDIAQNLHALIICTPPSARIPYVQAALERNLAVMTEKPLAHCLENAHALAALASKHPNVVTAVGYCHRFTPAMIEMKKRIAAGEIGEVVRFENTFASHLLRLKDHWMSDPAVSGGGVCIDTGCHSLDLFLYLVGPADVRGASFKHAWPSRGETHATLLVQSNGVAGVINSAWLEPPRFDVTIVGTKALLHYNYSAATELIFRTIDENSQTTIQVETHEVRFARQLKAFADAAQGKSAAIRPATFADALETSKAVDASIHRAGSVH